MSGSRVPARSPAAGTRASGAGNPGDANPAPAPDGPDTADDHPAGLFDEPARVVAAPVGNETSGTPGQRRRDRQLAAILAGQHPLSVALRSSLPLHPDARRDGARVDDGTPTCGGCRQRERLHGGASSYPKCTAAGVPRSRTDPAGKVWRWTEHPRATHGGGTDVAAWWPACRDYQPARAGN